MKYILIITDKFGHEYNNIFESELDKVSIYNVIDEYFWRNQSSSRYIKMDNGTFIFVSPKMASNVIFELDAWIDLMTLKTCHGDHLDINDIKDIKL